jgi:hypothetical protein
MLEEMIVVMEAIGEMEEQQVQHEAGPMTGSSELQGDGAGQLSPVDYETINDRDGEERDLDKVSNWRR